MLSKNAIKYYSTLLQKKYRERERKFIVEGKRLVEEATGGDYEFEIICVTDPFDKSHHKFVEQLRNRFRVEVIKEVDFNRLSDTKNPQGILAVLKKQPINFVFDPKDNFILALEDISDPGNMGTIIRNCDWFGVVQILLSENCAEIYNPKVLRSSMGSFFHLSFSDKVNFYAELDNLKKDGYKILCADLDGENLYQLKKNEKIVLVLASEAHGPSQRLLQLADHKLTIPKKGKAESLNVASASAVLLSELTK